MPIPVEALKKKVIGDPLPSVDEWNALLEAVQRTVDPASSGIGFVDALSDVRGTKHPGRPWFWCEHDDDVPKYSVFTISSSEISDQTGVPWLRLDAVDSSNVDGVLLTNGPYEGSAATGGVWVRFIDEWDPVVLKLFDANPLVLNSETGPKLGQLTVDTTVGAGSGLIAVCRVSDSDEYQWFVRAPGSGGGLVEGTLLGDLTASGVADMFINLGKGEGTTVEVSTGLLPTGWKILDGDYVVAAIIAGQYRVIAWRGCEEMGA
jgi:hypothetical protein